MLKIKDGKIDQLYTILESFWWMGTPKYSCRANQVFFCPRMRFQNIILSEKPWNSWRVLPFNIIRSDKQFGIGYELWIL
jgi:hypothetical protein